MREWHIWDFPDTNYIYLNDSFRKEFFEQIFKKLGGKRPAARFLGVSQKTLKDYFKGYTLKNNIKHCQSISIGFLKKASSLIDSAIYGKIEDNIYLIKARNKGTPIINPILPFKESCEFYRITAHIIGDGCAAKNHVPYYANKCKELREQFKEDLKIFGHSNIYEKETKTVPIVCFPKIITDILSFILEIRFTDPNHIPKTIFDASEECKSAFLRALYDDEGTMSTNLAISMSNPDIIKDISSLVENMGIRTNKIILKNNGNWKDSFSFNIERGYFKSFKDKIGFNHPDKIKNLDSAIITQNRKIRTRDKKDIEAEIIKLLENKSLKTIEIANNLKLTLGHALTHLKKIESENKIKREGFKNKLIWSRIKA